MTPTTLTATLQRLGLTQAGAARLLGVTDRQMRRWVKGTSPVPLLVSVVLAMMDAGRITTDDLRAS